MLIAHICDKIVQHMPQKTKKSKQKWFEKIIQNNKLLIDENKNIFLNISMTIKDIKKKKEFENFIGNIGNEKVEHMIRLMRTDELILWLPSMVCTQLEVFCKVLNIKQSGRKQEKIDRIVSSMG